MLLLRAAAYSLPMKDIDERLAEVIQKITGKLMNVTSENINTDTFDSEAFYRLNKKLLDLARFHRRFIKLQYGEEELVYRAVCYIEEVMLPSISGPELTGNWFHYTLQTVINIARPMLGPSGADGYDFLNDMDKGLQQMREMSFI
jgi:hypothetical protein